MCVCVGQGASGACCVALFATFVSIPIRELLYAPTVRLVWCGRECVWMGVGEWAPGGRYVRLVCAYVILHGVCVRAYVIVGYITHM